MLLNYAGTKSRKGHKHTLISVFIPQRGQRNIPVWMSEHNIVFLVTPEALQFHSTPTHSFTALYLNKDPNQVGE